MLCWSALEKRNTSGSILKSSTQLREVSSESAQKDFWACLDPDRLQHHIEKNLVCQSKMLRSACLNMSMKAESAKLEIYKEKQDS
ncbi:hypothetical protein ACU8KH_05109 [Lachancea thermotolerans]